MALPSPASELLLDGRQPLQTSGISLQSIALPLNQQSGSQISTENKLKAHLNPVKRAKITGKMLNAVKERNRFAMISPWYDMNWFNAAATMASVPVTAGRPRPEVAKDIIVGLVSAMKQRPAEINDNVRFLLVCVCKVLEFIKVPVDEIMQSCAEFGHLTSRTQKRQFKGVVWANKLMQGLYWGGWGHQAFDLLLMCMSDSCRRF